jgi:hypothetical protein
MLSNPDDLPEADLNDLFGPDWREFELAILGSMAPPRPLAIELPGEPDFFDIDLLAPLAEH